MNEKYQIEIQEFVQNFKDCKDKKIVLYGIGRYTATLLEGVRGFRFVGLMDKDAGNVGKTMFGLPVVDQTTAEQIADMVVINTSETYWDIIYQRIEDIQIPVFYKNGVRAEKKVWEHPQNPYRELSLDGLCGQIQNVQVVSFDFFDTLFMRAGCNPRDIFGLLEQQISDIWKCRKRFTEVRNDAIAALHENYSFDELYEKIKEISALPGEIIREVKNREIRLEQELLFPRTEILQVMKSLLEHGDREVWLISDMYFPKQFYMDIFQRYGVPMKEKNILISNELHKSKSDGSLWDYYASEVLKGRTALHIGDHPEADIAQPLKYGIRTYQTPNAWDLLEVSSLGKAASYVCSPFASAVMGMILKKLFSNPYALSGRDVTLEITTNQDMGYLVFGPVVLTFLLWLKQESAKSHVPYLIFMSRDGYFLKEDYDFLCSMTGENQNSRYIGISRQLAMSASITNEKDLLEYLSMPYSGTIRELFEDRLGITGVAEIPEGTPEQYIEKYHTEIWKKLSKIRKNYLRYLKSMKLDENAAVVDLGFYGNNQRYLNKLLDTAFTGYYFNANLSEQNINTHSQKMSACFQKGSDPTGAQSQVLKKMIFVESVLTAPYGMVKEIDEDGTFICAEKKQNQLHFRDKEEINQGLKKFIQDYITNFGRCSLDIDRDFVDWYYGYCLDGAFSFADKVKQSFYNDNAMMNRIESMLFY
jgi:predicted HAD superfamily hydrolase